MAHVCGVYYWNIKNRSIFSLKYFTNFGLIQVFKSLANSVYCNLKFMIGVQREKKLVKLSVDTKA